MNLTDLSPLKVYPFPLTRDSELLSVQIIKILLYLQRTY